MCNQLRRERAAAVEAGGVRAADRTESLVHRYLTASPDMVELFGILVSGEKDYALMWRLVDAFALLIGECHLGAFQATGVTVCQHFIRNFMRLFTSLLLAADDRIKHAALRLMLAICRYSIAACRDFFLKFNVTFDAFLALPFRPKYVVRSGGAAPDPAKLARAQETRELYMELVLTFLRAGQSDVVLAEKVLRVKGLVSSIFKGLAADPSPVVAGFLSAIRDSVLHHRILAARCGTKCY